MPRKQLIRTNQFPYHITTRSNNKEWFCIPIHEVWSEMQKLLEEGQHKFDVIIHASVLMSNHYHLLVTTPHSNIDIFMQFFNHSLGRFIAKRANRINRIFGAPYKWNLIKRDHYYQNVLRYIYQNPVRAHLVLRCVDYPFCDVAKYKNDNAFIEWINMSVSTNEDHSTKRNLRRSVIA